MSKYIPKIALSIPGSSDVSLVTGDPLHDQVATDVESYSITPRVLRCVKLLPSSASSAALSTHPLRSIEEYEYSGNSVLRYAINAQHIIPDTNNGSILGEGTSTPKTSGSVSTSRYVQADSQGAILHSLEQAILEDAIKYLQTSKTTVLVDFFERVQGKDIQTENGHPCIHTVVLHGHSNGVLVIDPSNFLYSSHLANTDFNGYLATKSLPLVVTMHKAIQIYQPPERAHEKGLIGPNHNQWRDCTDIAVKLAFGFNTNPLIAFDKNGIEKHPVVMSLSNLDTLDKTIFYDTKTIAARIKQVSSQTAQDDFCSAQHSIDCKIKLLKLEQTKLYPTLLRDIESKSLGILRSTTKPIETLKELTKLNDDFNKAFVVALDAESNSLQTGFSNYEAECIGLGVDFYS